MTKQPAPDSVISNPPQSEAEHYEAIRQRITARYNQRAEFFGHLVAYLVLNGVIFMLSGVSIVTPSEGLLSGLWVGFSALWAVGLLIHAVNFIVGELREKAIEKAIARERQTWQAAAPAPLEAEKPKRAYRLALEEDGELEEIIAVEDEPAPRRARH